MPLVTIIEEATQVDAALARVHLEAAGIRVIETNQASGSLGLGTALGGVTLMVEEQDYERAAAVLAAASLGEPVPAENWKCPACGKEVLGTFQVCWACGTAIDGTRDPDFHADVEDDADADDEADDADEEAAADSDDAPLGRLVTLIKHATQVDATLARTRLEAAGIRVVETNLATGSLGLGTALGGVTLMVDEEDYDRAAALLSEEPASDVVLVEPWKCPGCGQEVEGAFQVCWACGTAIDGTRDPDFHADVEEDEDEDDDDADDDSDDAPLGRLVGDEPPATQAEAAAWSPAEDENPYRSPRVPGIAAAPAPPPPQDSAYIDALAVRAFNAALLGVVFAATCPVFNIYSAWLLIRISFDEEQLGPAGSRRFYYAWGINLLSLLVFSMYLNLVWW